MTQTVQDVMSRDVVSLDLSATLADAAVCMRDSAVGDVLVVDNDRLCGIVTDRDLVVRGVAGGHDPARTKLEAIVSRDATTIGPDEPVEAAAELLRAKAIRRLPVVVEGHPVGVVTLADLAVQADVPVPLEDIAAAPPNS